MTANLETISTDMLLRGVSTLERRLIEGRATDADIDLYFYSQLELAERTFLDQVPYYSQAVTSSMHQQID